MPDDVTFAARRAWGPALLTAALLALAAPGSVLASTPLGTVGGTDGVPVDNSMGQLLGIAIGLAGVACAIAILLGIAFLVARIGGPAIAPTSDPGAPEPVRPRSMIGTSASVLVVVGAVVVGVLGGRAIAFERSMGGLGGVIGAGILLSGLLIAVVALMLIALIATKIRHGHMSRAIATTLAAAGLVAVGAAGGNATAAASGGVYHEPVVLSAAGQTNVELQTGSVPFSARDGGRADCISVPDGQTVLRVTALDLGELGSGTLRAMLNLSTQPSNATTVEFFIDGADLPEGSAQRAWIGSAQTSELSAGGAAGKLTFSGLPLSDPAAKPDPGASSLTPVASGWPASISGSLTWTCQPWAAPRVDGVAPPPSVAP